MKVGSIRRCSMQGPRSLLMPDDRSPGREDGASPMPGAIRPQSSVDCAPEVDVVTFGCRLNAGESDVIWREALKAGLSDTVIVNTCAVTAEAVRQCRQTVRRIKRDR